MAALAAQVSERLRFAHGDVTARNVLQAPDGMVLIDWGWAGLYPEAYDEAFLWFSLVDVPGGGAHVEALSEAVTQTALALRADDSALASPVVCVCTISRPALSRRRTNW